MPACKKTIVLFFILSALNGCTNNPSENASKDLAGFRKTTDAIRKAFANGDVEAVLSLHHPDVVKYFGGKNVVIGRTGLKKQLTDMFNYATVEFVQNDIESTVVNGNSVIETSLYGIRMVPKNGDSARIFRGRSMVVYIKFKDSPTGWASLREMTQDGPTQ